MRVAEISKTSDGTFYVIFGSMYKNDFICSHGKPGKFYKTIKSAENAKKEWDRS